MSATKASVRILHCHPPLSDGDGPDAARVMALLGAGHEHTIVAQTPITGAAKARLAKRADVRFPRSFPALEGRPRPGHLVSISQRMRGFDLIVTHGPDAIGAVMARTVFVQPYDLPPLIHHADGSEAEERRRWPRLYHRIALTRTHRLIVPGVALERFARATWKMPTGRIVRQPAGIDTARYAKPSKPKGLRLVKRPGERWVGTLAPLDDAEQLANLVRACAQMPDNWHLVAFGEGPARDVIADLAAELGSSDRVHLPGRAGHDAQMLGLLDIYAASPDGAKGPAALIAAMAAGLPVAGPGAGDAGALVVDANQPFVTAPGDDAALAAALNELAKDTELRARIGTANRDRARERFDVGAADRRLAEIYRKAIGTPTQS